jgi:hypothetical protein
MSFKSRADAENTGMATEDIRETTGIAAETLEQLAETDGIEFETPMGGTPPMTGHCIIAGWLALFLGHVCCTVDIF